MPPDKVAKNKNLKYFNGDWMGDCLILESYLDEMEFFTGSNRRKMCPTGQSCLYGVDWKGFLKYDKNGTKVMRPRDPNSNLFLTKARMTYPEFYDIAKEFQKLYFNKFEFKNIQLNRNYKIPKHIDSKNVGESILLCLGDYTGGKTKVYYENNEVDLDAHYELVQFNGSKYYHEVLPWEGNRLSLVFFN